MTPANTLYRVFFTIQPLLYLPGLCLCGLSEGVFPGVSLLSRWRLSGFPVESAVLFGPGLIPFLVSMICLAWYNLLF